MRLLYLISLSIGVYFLQFLILPFFNIHFNLFIPFALGFFLCEKKVSRIIFVSVIFDVFSGLPFPLMTVSLLLTFGALSILYMYISEDSDILKIFIVLPLSITLYWLFVYLSGLGFGLFGDYFSISFLTIFDLGLIWSILYTMGVATGFYILFKLISPEPRIYA